ncbi:hypothetical protein B6S44_05400 [Bosea sp. Tri-44]|uniref:hypothetical protein n=1 Tax=Bosea sp. Tri-44 TaxID=1972137 RepID=UPI00100FBC49|nr:hypothetical protein [Bosea sp. Tri-44]RXT56503.1 hypothetical protein B6S44_05400 [Bosea sp. Tri-44]
MQTPSFIRGAESARTIARQIESEGFAVIDDYVAPDQLQTAQNFVRQAVARNGGNYLAINGSEKLGGTFLHDLATDPGFIALCHGIYESSTGKPAPDTPFYQVLRCLAGSLAKANSLNFHYDSYLLTALIPVIIPDHGKTGDLLLIPNSRGIRSHYLTNFADKILLDNWLSQRLLRMLYARRHAMIRHLKLKPGNLYLFYGYRSIHTNEECSPDAIRSTALLHYFDPHAESSLKRMLRRN